MFSSRKKASVTAWPPVSVVAFHFLAWCKGGYSRLSQWTMPPPAVRQHIDKNFSAEQEGKQQDWTRTDQDCRQTRRGAVDAEAAIIAVIRDFRSSRLPAHLFPQAARSVETIRNGEYRHRHARGHLR